MLEGEISQINLIERLVELWREQFTGAIRFESDGIIKIVYFKGGDILSASTNDRADSVDEILMRAGKVSREHVKQALARRKENETLGDALLNLGFITRKELSWARRVQVVGVIRSIAAWSTGSFTIVADYLPKRDEGTLFALPQIIVELIVTEADRQKFERTMEGGEAVFAKTPSFDDVFRRLGLNEEAEQITNQVDGTQNAGEVASASGKDPFNVYKLLHALATLGVLAQVGKGEEVPQVSIDDFAAAGVADAADMWATEASPEPEPAVVSTPEPEPVIQAQPMFDFDEAEAVRAPTLEVPLASVEEPRTSSAWDDEEDAAAVETPASPMPSWDETPIQPAAAVAAESAAKEEQWGFDEAQIETARRAAVPVSAAEPIAESTATRRGRITKVPPKKSRFGWLVALMVVFILAAGGYYGFLWWQGKQDADAAAARASVVTPRPRPTPAPVIPPPTLTVPESTTAATATTTATTTQIASAETAPASSVGINPNTATAAPPATATTAPAPTRAPAAAQPMVVSGAAASGRERYDAMARQHLANSSGNFTVQIQILCDTSNLDKAMRAGGNDVWFVPQPIGARSCYRVLWGRFGTREEAQQAMGRIPAGLRDPAAAVKAVPRG
jgi:SPOR domain